MSVFICADEEVKIQELMKRHNITRDKAKDVMIKTDKQRLVIITIIPANAGAAPRAITSASTAVS